MMDLPGRVLAAIRADCLLQGGETVIVGVSGGPDSMALVHLLARLRQTLDLVLVAVYVDHGLRPQEAREEAALVRVRTEIMGIEYRHCRVDVRGHARLARLSIEDAARQLRYACLRDIAAGRGGKAVIAVGHTEDDQAENVLLRLFRGAGRRGIAGMRTRSGDLIRPLLGVGKAELLAWLGRQGIPFCEDSSNREGVFLRNRVRNELLPFLEARFDAGIKKALIKSAAVLAEEETLLLDLTDRAMATVVTWEGRPGAGEAGTARCLIDRKLFRAQPRALQRRIVEAVLCLLGSRSAYRQVIEIARALDSGRTGGELHLSQGLRLGIERERAILLHPQGRMVWRGRLYERSGGKGRDMGD